MPFLKKQVSWGLVLLISLSAVLLIAIVPVDYEWTVWLYENRWPRFAEFMRRTLFEGSYFGGSDFAILFQIFAVCAYFYVGSGKKGAKRFVQWHPMLGYLLVCALVTGLGAVHSSKWLMGRARPHIVLKDELPFTHWYEFGPHFVSDGAFFGSFLSGHTAVVFLLMAVAYLLAGHPQSAWKYKTMGGLWGGLVIIYTILMAIGRSMTRHHWLSDSLATIGVSWIVMHFLYFQILHIPEQIDYWNRHRKWPPLPKFWEFRLCFHALMIILGLMGMVIGLRSLWLQKAPWLIILIFPGIAAVYHWGKQIFALYGQVKKVFTFNPDLQ
ncbi:MAG: phosphatase PAP2 family protein [SAR324 cluster bacterium]|nr:phosphatase PAP2 family protein [SAR324 cluster bacterium]